MRNNFPETILVRLERQNYSPEKTLIAAILRQAWSDSKGIINSSSRLSREKESNLARLFLTGNYSRELFKEYCLSLDLSPNYLIKKAMQCPWSKNIKPRYFREM